ncbi:MAG: hypothetical protein AB1492_09570 [Bacillota bacterium]
MLRLSLGLWKSDWLYFVAGGLLIALAVGSYGHAWRTVEELNSIMYEPVRRILGGEIAVVHFAAQLVMTRDKSGKLWVACPNFLLFPESDLPPGEWVWTKGILGRLHLPGQTHTVNLFARSAPYPPKGSHVLVAGRPVDPARPDRHVVFMPHDDDMERLGLRLGSQVTLEFESGDRGAFEIIGTYLDILLGWPTLFVHPAVVEDAIAAGATPILCIAAVSGADWTAQAMKSLAAALPPSLKVVSAADILRGLTAEAEHVRDLMGVIQLATVCTAMAGLLALVLYAIAVRQRELAFLLAMGVAPSALAIVLAVQFAVLGGTGALVGLLGAGLARTGSLGFMFKCAGTVAGVAGVMALIPGRLLLNVDPASVLKGE